MVLSMLHIQRDLILDTIRNTARGEWKVLVLDEGSRRIIDNVVREDDILKENITNIEQIEQRRPMNKELDAVYILSPQPHIVECLMADFERRRYRRSFLLWTSILPPNLRERIDRSSVAREQIAVFRVLNIEYYPRESHLVTFRDPWSFPILYHPACSNLVRHHMADLAQKIVAVCVSLGEYPTIRYYEPRKPLPTHESSVLCSYLARAVQDEIDVYAQYHSDFPPPSSRPRGTLYVVDRSLDLFSPFVHEFTYQAMAFDLLPIKDGDKITYRVMINEGRPDQEEKDIEIAEKDRIWVENRHRHMKDTLVTFTADFERFMRENKHFAESGENVNLNQIKDMMAGLSSFQEGKEAYALHLNMAQDSMAIFQKHKLPDLASLEQSLATGLDEDYKKPKNLADQVVRMLDEEAITAADRLRLIALYLLYKDGLLASDILLLRSHANIPPQDEEVLRNLELLGARITKPLKDQTPTRQPLFPPKRPPASTNTEEDYSLSRFEPNLRMMLEEHIRGTLDPSVFPFVKPDPSQLAAQSDPSALVSSESLRTAKPTWATSKGASTRDDKRQRVIVFVAGGATYSESRACYEVNAAQKCEVVLVTSHMLTPGLWMRQLGDLTVERRRLGIPADTAKKRGPTWIDQERDEEERKRRQAMSPPASGASGASPAPSAGRPAPSMVPAEKRDRNPLSLPTKEMGRLNLNGNGQATPPGSAPSSRPTSSAQPEPRSSGKLTKDKDGKKKHHFFSGKK